MILLLDFLEIYLNINKIFVGFFVGLENRMTF